MKKIIILVIFSFIIGGLIMSVAQGNVFKLKSDELKNNSILPDAQVYNGYGCTGENVSPQLSWENAPINTKSFAIICHDPDAPRENGWYHWLVVNIPNNINSIKKAGKIEGSTETLTDFNTTGYGGACPPVNHGIHRYNFTIYALDVEKLENITANSKPKDVELEIAGHVIAKSTITGLYERK